MQYISAGPQFRISEMLRRMNGRRNMIFINISDLYAYRTETLKKITLLPRSSLEISESLEQNRWLENGYRIRTAVTLWESIGIDTPDDLEKAKILLKHFI